MHQDPPQKSSVDPLLWAPYFLDLLDFLLPVPQASVEFLSHPLVMICHSNQSRMCKFCACSVAMPVLYPMRSETLVLFPRHVRMLLRLVEDKPVNHNECSQTALLCNWPYLLMDGSRWWFFCKVSARQFSKLSKLFDHMALNWSIGIWVFERRCWLFQIDQSW